MASEQSARREAAKKSLFGAHGVTVCVYRGIAQDGRVLGYFTTFGQAAAEIPGIRDARTEPVAIYRAGAEIGI